VNTDLAKLQAVTAADVQRVMKKYFTAANRLVIYYLPEAARTKTTTSGLIDHSGGQQGRSTEPVSLRRRGGQGR
jgi:hypothetical protein